ncbi:MAG: radical SAM protein [Deltaproteobacteria bacterium]|jgi:radical SAM protein with 4Fe4S-binding SPASM domain|nr:radical SAM protein [Deltaproteobacteria bacterium]
MGEFHPTSDRGPDEIGLEKILLFPEKLSSLQKNLTDVDPLYPVSVELSLTSRCNLKCVWCSDLLLRELCPDRLSLDVLGRLFVDLAKGGTRGVTIEGGGEPTISPFFQKAATLAAEAGLSVGLITNGTALFNASRSKDFYSLFQWVRLSLDASCAEDYLLLKGRDCYQDVLKSLSVLANLKSPPTLGVGYVLTNRNDSPEPLEKLALDLRRLGVNYLHLRPVVDHPELVSLKSTRRLKELESPHFHVNTGAMTDNQGQGNDGLPCLAHSLSAVITADGSVWLCGRLNVDPSTGSMGNITVERFSDVWSGEMRKRQSRRAADGHYCLSHCPQCRMTKYNRLLYNLSRIRTRDFI